MTAAATSAGLFEVELPRAPYPGLRPFERHEWPIFFGREPMIRDVITRLLDQNLVVVHGDSGCGKSSLIRAGVLVQLEQQHERAGQEWRTCTMLPRDAPLQNLAKELAKLDAAEPDRNRIRQIRRCLNLGRDAPAALAELLRRGEDDHVCILVDQFEELFSFARKHGRDEAQLFVDILFGLQENPPPGLYAILTMRSEFLGVCARFKGLAEAVNRTQYLLPQMERPALLRAIREPATLYHGEVSRELAERLIADAGGGQDQLPLIQHGLMLLWRRKAVPLRGLFEDGSSYVHPAFELAEARMPFHYGDGAAWRLGLEDYQGSGLATLLSDHADEIMAAAAPDPKREKIVEHLFRALTDINAEGSAVRRPQTMAELMAVTRSDEQTLRSIIDHFRADGVSLLRPYGNDEIEPKNEIDTSHEALIRCWHKIAHKEHGWLQREFKDGLAWQSLRIQAQKFIDNAEQTLSAAATADWDLWLKTLPSETWSDRYGGGWSMVRRLMRASRRARSVAEQRERQAYIGDSRFRAEQARRQLEHGFPVAAVQLALAGLPDEPDHVGARPWVDETANVLIEAMAMQREFKVLRDHAGPVTAVAVSPDGSRIVSGCRDRTLRVWNTTTGERQLVLCGHDAEVLSTGFSPDSARVVSGSGDKTVRVWDVANGENMLVLRGHQGEVTATGYSPDGSRILSGSRDGAVRVWEASGRELLVLYGHNGPITAAGFSQDGAKIVTGSDDQTVRLWDVATAEEVLVLRGHTDAIAAVAISPESSRIVSGSRDRTVRVWDGASGAELMVLTGHSAEVLSIGFSPDGARVVSGSGDNTVRVWDVANGENILILRGHVGPVFAATYSTNGRHVVSGSNDQTIRLWEAGGAKILVLRGHTSPVLAAAFSPDGAQLVSGSDDGTARVWDAASGKELLVLCGHKARVLAAAFSPDAGRVVTGSADGTVRLWDPASGTELLVLRGHENWVRAARFSPDGGRIVSGSDDQTVRVWDAMSGKPIAVLRGQKGYVMSAVFSPDGTRFLTGSEDATVWVWDARRGKAIVALHGHEKAVRAVAFSPDGAQVASASSDRTIRLWDAASGKDVTTLRGHSDAVLGIGYSPDGARLVSASFDETVRVWNTASGEELLVLSGHEAGVWVAAFSPEGDRIVSASDDATLRITSVPRARSKQELIKTARARLPRELTEEERRRFYLAAE